MISKHLTAGSVAPSLIPGKLRLYSMRFCPFAQRVHLVLAAKKIPHDVVYINLGNKPDWYLAKNPVGNVPCVELENGDILNQSDGIVDYLYATYTEGDLSRSNEHDKLLIKEFNELTSLMYKLFVEKTVNPELFEKTLNNFEKFNNELIKRDTPFFNGHKPGKLDFMIWPWFERSHLIRILKGEMFTIPTERFPRLAEWFDAMKKDPAVKASYLEPEIHAKFMEGYIIGEADYDMLAKK